jgi:hypothetical protein
LAIALRLQRELRLDDRGRRGADGAQPTYSTAWDAFGKS